MIIWDEIKAIRSGKKELREFGFTFAVIFAILGGIVLWRGKGSWPYLFTAAVLFGIPAAALPAVLLPLQKAWMAFSVVIGFFMSRLVLALLFYGVVTPIGLLMRLTGKDILDERIDRGKGSYWQDRPPAAKDRASYEKQF
ncbi:MAG: SxtJ family membrane protein [Candidatus Omnitrophota bacterium]